MSFPPPQVARTGMMAHSCPGDPPLTTGVQRRKLVQFCFQDPCQPSVVLHVTCKGPLLCQEGSLLPHPPGSITLDLAALQAEVC